jgi:hypothetical protein
MHTTEEDYRPLERSGRLLTMSLYKRRESVCVRPYVTASELQIYILGYFSTFRT